MNIALLEKACDLHGQRGVARLIKKSPATVNQILKGAYPNPQRVLAIVAETFSSLEPDECPVLGAIHPDVCERYSTWAKEGVVHKDRLYMQVKMHCENCIRGVNNE